MIKIEFKKTEKLLDKRGAMSVIMFSVNSINRNSKVWYFEVAKGIFYFNYNNSNIIKSIEGVKGWI